MDHAPHPAAASGRPPDDVGSELPGGALVVGHGTRAEHGQSEFLALAAQVGRLLAPTPVEPCFLELAAPSIAAGVERLVARGARRLVVAPTLLFSAGHANHDIPNAVSEACCASANRWGIKLAWEQAATLEEHPALVELSLAREREAVAGRAPRERCGRLLVGRGSGDVRAIRAFWEFAAERRAAGQVPAQEGCFLAVAEPRLPEALERMAGDGWDRVIVIPHLLFDGELITGVNGRVADMARRFPAIDWVVAQRLGPDRAIAAALCDRVLQATKGLQ